MINPTKTQQTLELSSNFYFIFHLFSVFFHRYTLGRKAFKISFAPKFDDINWTSMVGGLELK